MKFKKKYFLLLFKYVRLFQKKFIKKYYLKNLFFWELLKEISEIKNLKKNFN
jgi:hypothetical protein